MKLSKEERKKWEKVREDVKILQDNRCYLCDKKVKGRSAHIHHIIDRRIKSLMFELDNLVLLCPRCHELGPFGVHKTAIYFSNSLLLKEPERYYKLLDKIAQMPKI